MEIKTCEQYVVARLQELEDTHTADLATIQTLQRKVEEYAATIEMVRSRIKVTQLTSQPGRYYLEMENVWSSYDKETFDQFCTLLNLEIPEPEVPEDEEEG